MSGFTIAAAQYHAVRGDVEANVRTHCEFVRVALNYGVNVIIFPELSLTGYEPEIAAETTIDNEDSRLAPLKELASAHRITIVAGAPIRSERSKPFIGAIIIEAENSGVYIKNHLHPGEEGYFSSADPKPYLLQRDGQKIALAICADVNHPSHAAEAAKKRASIYAAGVLMMDGYDEAARQLQSYASKHSMAAIMANYAAPTGGYTPAGKSAVWDDTGVMKARADEMGDALVLLIKENQGWSGRFLSL